MELTEVADIGTHRDRDVLQVLSMILFFFFFFRRVDRVDQISPMLSLKQALCGALALVLASCVSDRTDTLYFN